MATRIIEYGGQMGNGGFPSIPAAQKVTSQAAMTATASPGSSSAFNAATGLVCVNTDEQIYVAFGPAGTNATTNDFRINANDYAFFQIMPGQSWTVSIRT